MSRRKKATLVLMGIIIIFVGTYFVQSQTHYVAPEVIEREVEVERTVNLTEKRIQQAQEAAMSDIESKAQAAYDAMKELELNKIKASVLKDIEDELKEERIRTEEEIGAY